MARLTLNLGALGHVSAESDDPREIIKELEFWRSLPTACPVCGQPTELRYQRVVAKSGKNAGKQFDYYRLRCINPNERHETTLGQHADGGGLFYPESREWTAYRAHHDDTEADDAPHPPAATSRPAPRPTATPAPPDVSGMTVGEFRTYLGRQYGLKAPVQQRLAERALKRPVTDWSSLTTSEMEVIAAAAADAFVGRAPLPD